METEAETTGSRQEGLSPNHSAGNGKDARRDGETVAPTTTLKQPSEMAQMVCGSCRRLLSYPQGTRHVECSCCQTVNFVLEAHQVGQVKCGSCAVLLMYPYGAPSVRCSSCRFVTEIGVHNRRLPLSVQQGHQLPLHSYTDN
ncbi:hypothetical protein VitviT2T_014999 [Vitis vinifera]|uniref:Zinc finger LSD1-type domain-containing protein n=2 Tax=Vitis vinifera TaxID=29760 RepID=A0ABY9CM82_VITVI|eukprot:XP_002273964.1 PREDICTED: protein LOL2 [Vitis vinifera]